MVPGALRARYRALPRLHRRAARARRLQLAGRRRCVAVPRAPAGTPRRDRAAVGRPSRRRPRRDRGARRGGPHGRGPVAGAITNAVSNQGVFVRPGTGLTDAGLFGFTFSTQSELLVAQALERRRVWWTGLVPVRVNDDAGAAHARGGLPRDRGRRTRDSRTRRWPHDGRAAEDHAKDRASKRAGIWVVERVPSAEALHAPDQVVNRFLGMLRAFQRRAA